MIATIGSVTAGGGSNFALLGSGGLSPPDSNKGVRRSPEFDSHHE
jgi:hypothetical protein